MIQRSIPHNRQMRKCVFCGSGKLSAEHIWSQWMRDLLPSSDGYQEIAQKRRGEKTFGGRILRDAQGPITNKRLRRVCKPCNNGWMGKKEEAAKPLLTKLITGTPTVIKQSEVGPLLDWLVTKLIVLDVMRDGEQTFTEQERSAFYTHGTIPRSLSVWLLQCGDGPWKTLIWSHAQRMTIVIDDTWVNAKPPAEAGPNLKLFLWGVGEALFVAYYEREIDFDLVFPEAVALKLIPDQWSEISWPPKKVTANEAASLQHTLTRLGAGIGARLIHLGEDGEPINS